MIDIRSKVDEMDKKIFNHIGIGCIVTNANDNYRICYKDSVIPLNCNDVEHLLKKYNLGNADDR